MSRLMTKQQNGKCAQWRQISLGIRPVWSESLLFTWRKLGSLATHWAHSEDPDQTRQMSMLVWVFAGNTLILLVLSWGSSDILYIYRGVGMASKMPSRILKKECAGILENMKVSLLHFHICCKFTYFGFMKDKIVYILGSDILTVLLLYM